MAVGFQGCLYRKYFSHVGSNGDPFCFQEGKTEWASEGRTSNGNQFVNSHQKNVRSITNVFEHTGNSKSICKRVDKTSVYSVEWAGKTQGKFSDKKKLKIFVGQFQYSIYGGKNKMKPFDLEKALKESLTS